MDFAKLQKRIKESRDEAYVLTDEQAEDQIYDFVNFYDIDLSFEIDGLLDEDLQAELAQMSDDEKKAGGGIKQILKDVAHWIKLGTISIVWENDDLIIKHRFIKPIGEQSEKSTALTEFIYSSVKPKHTEKMSGLKEDKYTFSQRAELLMSFLADQPITIFNKLSQKDKRAARSIGILLLIAL